MYNSKKGTIKFNNKPVIKNVSVKTGLFATAGMTKIATSDDGSSYVINKQIKASAS